MRKKREGLEAMSTEELKVEWAQVCKDMRNDQREYFDVMARMKQGAGRPISYLAEEELEISERYHETVEYVQLIGDVMHDRL